MDKYEVQVDKRVLKSLRKFPANHLGQVQAAMKQLEVLPRPQDAKLLKRTGGYRKTVGEYRILYTISDPERLVTVYKIVKRNDFSYQDE